GPLPDHGGAGDDDQRASTHEAKPLLLPELVEQQLTLLRTEPAHATARGDVQLFHDLLRPHLADARQGLEHRRNLHLAQGAVITRCLENISERSLPRLQLPFDLCALLASLCCFRKGLRALFGGERGKSHRHTPSFGGRSGTRGVYARPESGTNGKRTVWPADSPRGAEDPACDTDRIGRVRDRASDDETVGAALDRGCGRQDAHLVVPVRSLW